MSKNFKVKNALNIQPSSVAGSEAGDLRVDSGDSNKLKFHNGITEVTVGDDADLQDHIDDTADAHSASAITNVPSGNLAATDVQSALDEIQTDVDTRALGSELTAHIDDASEAHAASAISTVPAGNLAASDVQSALDELQTDVDSRATDAALSSHISDATDAHAASAITNTPSGNLAASTVQAALDELQTDIDTRATTTALSNHEADTTSIHGIADTSLLVTTTGTQALSNKDIDGGTASDTSRITIPKASKATLDALTRKEGTVVYASDLDKLYYDDGSTLTEVGSGSGTGKKNYLSNGNLETDITDWSTYDDTTTYADGTGGSPSAITIARNTITPLAGTADLKISKAASSATGEGVSVLSSTIDKAKRGKNLFIIMEADFSHTNYVSGDVYLKAYDVTNGAILGVNYVSGFNSSGGILKAAGKLVAYITTASTTASIRLSLHCLSDSASGSAWDAYVDEVELTPDSIVPGAIVTDLGTEAWTVVNATGTSSIRLSRIGNRIFADGTVTLSNVASGLIGLTIPAAYTSEALLGSNNTMVGWAKLIDTGTSVFEGTAQLTTTTNLSFFAQNVASTYLFGANTSSTIPHTWAATDVITFRTSWIVSGWAASGSISTTEAMLSGAMARYYSTAGQTIPTGADTIINYGTKDFDYLSSVTTGASWKFTSPTAMYYNVHFGNAYSSTTANQVYTAYKNGSSYQRITQNVATENNQMNGSFGIWLNAGEYFDIRATHFAGADRTLDTTAADNWINISPAIRPTVFGLYGNFELIPATSSTKTPSASGQYQAHTGNSITLTTGTWRLFGQGVAAQSGSASYSGVGFGWYGGNGGDSSSTPTALSAVTGLTILSAVGSGFGALNFYKNLNSTSDLYAPAPEVFVRVTTASVTVYLNSYAEMTTAANARITMYANAERRQ